MHKSDIKGWGCFEAERIIYIQGWGWVLLRRLPAIAIRTQVLIHGWRCISNKAQLFYDELPQHWRAASNGHFIYNVARDF